MRSSVFLNTCSWWGPILADIGQEACYSMDRSPGQSKHLHKKCINWYIETKKINTKLTNARTQTLHLSFMLNFSFWNLTLTLQSLMYFIVYFCLNLLWPTTTINHLYIANRVTDHQGIEMGPLRYFVMARQGTLVAVYWLLWIIEYGLFISFLFWHIP